MGALDPLDPLLRQHPVELAPGAAIAIGDEDALMGLAARADLAPHPLGDLVRPVVPDRRQAGDVEPVPAMDPLQLDHLAGQRAAGDEKGRAVAYSRHLGHDANVGIKPPNGHIPRDSRCSVCDREGRG